MKIFVLPGVGFHNKVGPIYMVDYLKEKFPNDVVEYFNWKHTGTIPPPPDDMSWWLKKTRAFAVEAILDFDTVVAHALETYVPPGDIYIGHSAGSVLAIVQGKPAVTFGSPYQLVSKLDLFRSLSTKPMQELVLARKYPIFNVVNENDILALPIGSAENYTYKAGWNPLNAHWDYWSNKKVCKKIAEKVEEYRNLLP